MMGLDLLLMKLEGKLTNQQEADFQDWLQESDENLRFYQKLEMLKQEGKGYHLYENIDLETAWNEVLEKAATAQLADSPESSNSSRLLFPKYRTLIAAAILVLLVSTGAYLYYVQTLSGEVLKETAFGEKATFMLPDQSEVFLNANSSLRYNKNQPRKIWLTGEAYFKVSKKYATREKFWVITPDLTVEVLGTAFNVNSHQEKTRVSLEEGSIKLNLHGETLPDILMVPGELLTYSKKNGADFEKKRIETNLESSWKAGIQLFEKTPLPEILDKIEEIYGVSIQLRKESLNNRLITMGIPVEDFDIALATIEHVLGVKITQVDSMHYYIK